MVGGKTREEKSKFMEARDMIASIMDYVREAGVEVDIDDEQNQTWELGPVRVQSYDEYTNRIFSRSAGMEIDVRENTFTGIRYHAGDYAALEAIFARFQEGMRKLGYKWDGGLRDTALSE